MISVLQVTYSSGFRVTRVWVNGSARVCFIKEIKSETLLCPDQKPEYEGKARCTYGSRVCIKFKTCVGCKGELYLSGRTWIDSFTAELWKCVSKTRPSYWNFINRIPFSYRIPDLMLIHAQDKDTWRLCEKTYELTEASIILSSSCLSDGRNQSWASLHEHIYSKYIQAALAYSPQ